MYLERDHYEEERGRQRREDRCGNQRQGSHAMLKPWPADAIMIVAASPESANVPAMDLPQPGQCRDCGAAVLYCSRTMARAQEVAAKTGGRPIRFFCLGCASLYDVAMCNRLIDHSGGESLEVFDEKGAGL
jgi:hypothetical protein